MTHHSHRLFVYRGLVYCNKCGARGPSRLNKLADACEPPSADGQRMLNAVRAGVVPPGLDSWPDDSFPVEFDQADLPEEERLALDRVKAQFRELRSNLLSGTPVVTSSSSSSSAPGSTSTMQQVGYSVSVFDDDSD